MWVEIKGFPSGSEEPDTFHEVLRLGILRIYNSRITRPSYKTELRIMTPKTELLTLKFFLKNVLS